MDAVVARAYDEFARAPSGRAPEDLDVDSPEDVTATHELQACVAAALEGLPAEWRRSREELARVFGKPATEMDYLLEPAGAYLRQRLTEAACLPRR